jgi:hypothetical protein
LDRPQALQEPLDPLSIWPSSERKEASFQPTYPAGENIRGIFSPRQQTKAVEKISAIELCHQVGLRSAPYRLARQWGRQIRLPGAPQEGVPLEGSDPSVDTESGDGTGEIQTIADGASPNRGTPLVEQRLDLPE